MEKLRVGVVGVGYLGKFHAQKYAKIPEVALVGVCDPDREARKRVADDLGTDHFGDYREFLGKVDAVSIVTPTPLHYDISATFLENDVDLLIEKPMTVTVEEADALIEKAEERGRIIQVGHLERYNPAVVALKGILKKPRFIESHRLSTFKGRGTDVSVVLDLMIHDIDIILNFVRSEVTEIHAAGIAVISDHVDIANARLGFANGCVANITASRISMKDERKVRLFQKDAYISVDFANRQINIIEQEKKAEEDAVIPGMGVREFCFTQADALDDEIKAFVHSVIHRKEPQVSGQVGRDALKVALSVMEQIKSTSGRFNKG